MTAIPTRRARNGALTLVSLATLLAAMELWERGLRDPAMLSGWTLLALVSLLAVYGVKKALPFLPLGNSTAWMQLHSWAGFLSIAVFLLHAGVRVPTGMLETLAGLAFVLVAGSGVAGLALARLLPPMLRVRGEPILYSRIPALRRELAAKAAAVCAPSRALADFHRLHLAAWLAGPADALAHLRGSRLPIQRRLEQIESLYRYLNEEEQATARSLMDVVKQKDLLDVHHAGQGALRAWTMIHVPVTGALIVLAIVHGTSVLAFRGGF